MAQKPLSLEPVEEEKPKLNLEPVDEGSDIDLSIPKYGDVKNEPEKPPEKEGWLSRAWRTATEPLTNVPSRFAKSVSEYINPERTTTGLRGIGSAYIESLGDVTSGLSSPLNLALAATTGGTSLASKAALPEIAQALNLGTKALSAPIAIHGLSQTFGPDKSFAERGLGAIEAAGGLLGLRSKVPAIGKSLAEATPETIEPWIAKEMGDINKIRSGQGNDLLESYINEIQNQPAGKPELANIASTLEKPYERPPGPWDQNVDVRSQPGVTEDTIFRIAQERFGMGKPLPENAPVTGAGPIPGEESSITQPQISAKFQGWQPGYEELPPTALYNIEGGPMHGGTVSADTLRGMGIEVPETPPYKPQVEPQLEFDPKNLNFEDTLKSSLADRMKETVEPTKLNLEEIPPKQASEFGPDEEQSMQSGGKQPPNNPPPNRPLFNEELNPDIPIQKRETPEYKPSLAQELYNLPRGLMSVDLPFMTSAAFRQASPLAWTGDWFKAWGKAAQAYGSEAAHAAIEDNILSSKYFKPVYRAVTDKTGNVSKYREMPSFAETVGLKMSDLKSLTSREENIASSFAEKIPGYGRYVRASNRAYTSFLNDLRKNQFEKLMQQATDAGLNPESNLSLSRNIADFINNATGRGKLEIGVGHTGQSNINLEQNTKLLANALFSPRLIASRIKFLNPFTYVQADPLTRQEYIKGLVRSVGTWWGLAGLAEMAGAKVSKDPNSADFGKIRIGDNRIDPGAGFQQYLVLLSRMSSGKFTSSSTGKQSFMGAGFKPRTKLSTAEEFAANKLHPTAKLAYDLMNANQNRPFKLGDEITQRALPMFVGDIMQASQSDPELAAAMGVASSIGMGTQSYGMSNFNKSIYIPEKYDINIGRR